MSSVSSDERRHSRALIPALITDPIAKAEAEAANGLLQYDQGVGAIQSALELVANRNRWKLRPSLILALQRRALDGISSFAGTYRPGPVEIEKSAHKPPAAHLVPELVEDLCDYVNDNWEKSAIHLSSFVLWRLNWIHPFDDGNGRTSRIVSYVVLLVRTNHQLGGSPTIPDLITQHRAAYFAALDAADAHLAATNRVDVTKMEALLSALLAKQLASIYDLAGGTVQQGRSS